MLEGSEEMLSADKLKRGSWMLSVFTKCDKTFLLFQGATSTFIIIRVNKIKRILNWYVRRYTFSAVSV